MISQQVKTVGIAGVVLGIACVGIGVWFVMALMQSQQKQSELVNAQNEMERLCKPPFPNTENIERTRENQKTLEAWVISTTNELAQGDVPMTEATPAKFKSELEDAIRELVSQSAVQGRSARVAPDFRFGFDKYKGDVLPETPDVPRLNQQLDTIKLLIAELYGANVVKLDAVTREIFESDALKEDSASTARRKNKPQEGGGAAGATARAPTDLFDSQRFTVAFQAYPDTVADVLNRLSTMSIFVVVSEVEVKKTGELAMQTKKETVRQVEPLADGSDAPPAVQIVTNPQDEPPVNVRLVLDVYSFKGV